MEVEGRQDFLLDAILFSNYRSMRDFHDQLRENLKLLIAQLRISNIYPFEKKISSNFVRVQILIILIN